MTHQINRRPMPILRLLLLLLVLIFVCFGVFAVTVDRLCNHSIEQWAPYYPNAVEDSADYNFLRPRSVGEGHVVLRSPDDVETVKQFYRDNTIELMHSGAVRGLASTNWQVEPDPEGDGSIIILFSACAV